MSDVGLCTKIWGCLTSCCNKGCSWRDLFGWCCPEEHHLRKQEIEYILKSDNHRGQSESGSSRRNSIKTLPQDDPYAEQDGYSTVSTCSIRSEHRTSICSSGSGSLSSVKDCKADVYQHIEARRTSVVSRVPPIIDYKPIEFWPGLNKEAVQPRSSSRASIQADKFNPYLYGVAGPSSDDPSDDEGLNRYNLGRIHFSVQYEIPNKLLLTKIIEARDLPLPGASDRQDMAHSNPYVRVCLLPDHKNARQTSVRRKTQNPVFEQTFAFELPVQEVQQRTLQIKIKDFDKYSRHCSLGQVLLPLSEVNIVKGKHMWRSLCPCVKELPELGEILLSLNYLPTAGRLNVDIVKARQLLQTDMFGNSAPFVRLALLRGDTIFKTRKTTCKRSTLDPVFNESFSFNITRQELHEATLITTVLHYNAGIVKDDFVGRIILGKQNSGPEEANHWSEMLTAQRSPVVEWHTLHSREVCDLTCPLSRTVP